MKGKSPGSKVERELETRVVNLRADDVDTLGEDLIPEIKNVLGSIQCGRGLYKGMNTWSWESLGATLKAVFHNPPGKALDQLGAAQRQENVDG